RPQREPELGVERRPAAGDAAPPRHGRRQKERREAERDDRQEEPRRRGALVQFGREALEMLLDEEEMRELGVEQRNGHKQRRRDQEENDRAEDRPDVPDELPVALDQDVKAERRERQDDACRAFAQ